MLILPEVTHSVMQEWQVGIFNFYFVSFSKHSNPVQVDFNS